MVDHLHVTGKSSYFFSFLMVTFPVKYQQNFTKTPFLRSFLRFQLDKKGFFAMDRMLSKW